VNNELGRIWKEAVDQSDAPAWHLSGGTGKKMLSLNKTAIVLAKIKVRCLPNMSKVSPHQKTSSVPGHHVNTAVT
jgi:hypothetical protein